MLRPFIRSGLGFRFKIDCPLSQCNHLLRMSLQVLAYFVSSESLHCLQRRVKELVGDFCEKHRKIFTRHSEPDSKQVLSHQGLILISANQPLIACTGRVKSQAQSGLATWWGWQWMGLTIGTLPIVIMFKPP